jgi:Protein of unknown function (DUF3435)
LSSIWTEWKFFRLLYQQKTGRKIDQVVGIEISDVGIPWDPSFVYWTDISWQYILGSLTDEYDLDLSVRDKPTLGIEDLLVILRYHWCLDASFTAYRPGALVESSCARGSNEALRYRYVVLRVLANPNSNDRILAMEVSLHFMKGRRNKSRP